MVIRVSITALALALAACLPKDYGIFIPERTSKYHFPGNEVPADLLDELDVFAADGIRISAVLARQTGSGTRPTVVYLHGQAENIDDAWGNVQMLWDRGYNVLAVDYRGFGRSDGTPTERGLYLDAAAAIAAVRADPRLDPDRVVLWGYSLGSGVASQAALEAPILLLVLEAPFTSMTAMVEWSSAYGIPGDWYTGVELDTLGRIAEIRAPLVVVHGTADRRVPEWMTQQVFDRATSPKAYVAVGGAAHDEALEKGLDAIVAAVEALSPNAAP